jgi:hypothetical protein
MNEWEYFRVAVSYRASGTIDFVARKDKDGSSIATHGGMKAHFNVPPAEWEAFQGKLREDGWELENVDRRDEGRSETYIFRRAKV